MNPKESRELQQLRREAHRRRQNRPPKDDLTKPLEKLVKVRCLNPDCEIQNVIHQAADLTSLLPPKDINYLNGHSPIVGPCVVCGQHTTEVVPNEK